jgi:hypothetical protein
MYKPVPPQGDEKESLVASLERHFDVVLWKIDGLDDEQLRPTPDTFGYVNAWVTEAPGVG